MKQFVDLEAAAVGGIEADDVQVSTHVTALAGTKKVCGQPAAGHRGAGPVEHRGREAEPGVPAAARHLPLAAHPVAAVDLVGAP